MWQVMRQTTRQSTDQTMLLAASVFLGLILGAIYPLI
jgi:hypothetical protein